MALRKISIDNSVKCIHSANTPPIETSIDSKSNTRKRKPSNSLSQKNKKNLEDITGEGFITL